MTTADRDANGLATITIDPMNRITQDAYDSKGNVTKVVNPDGSTVTYGTYNSFAEPASMTDELGRITTYTYDSHGNMTVVEDPATNVTTYTYSATQPGMLTARRPPRRRAIRATRSTATSTIPTTARPRSPTPTAT